MELDELRKSLEAQSTEELVAICRDRDEDEWRPEVFDLVASILASRRISVADLAARGPKTEVVAEPRQLVTLARYFSGPEAHAARTALEASGIAAWVADESLGREFAVAVGTRLQVRAEDERDARDVLEGMAESVDDLPTEIAEPPCSRCRSRGVKTVSEIVEDPDVPRGRGGRRSRQWFYECGSCGHRWLQDDE